MIRKILLKIRELIDFLLGESPGKKSCQQKIIALGDNNTIIIIGDKNKPNLILPKDQNNVKHFSEQNLKSRK